MSGYKVELDVYNGPLDLLLFLIRRDEVDIYDIPIAAVTEQYVSYVTLLQDLDPNMASEFLVMAATLMEIKSRTLLPRPPVEEGEEEDFSDPRLELVRQLLEYKKYKDAASSLATAKEIQSQKHQRVPVTPRIDQDELDLEEVQVWDLLEAFQKILGSIGKRTAKHEVFYDDTPIALHAADILDLMGRNEGRQNFQRLFEGRTKSQLIGLFLAVLELIRQKRIRAIQEGEFSPIELDLLDATPININEDVDYSTKASSDDDGEDVVEETDVAVEDTADIDSDELAEEQVEGFDSEEVGDEPVLEVLVADDLEDEEGATEEDEDDSAAEIELTIVNSDEPEEEEPADEVIDAVDDDSVQSQ